MHAPGGREVLGRLAHALRRARERSFHFPGHYLAPSFSRTDADGCEAALEVGPHCKDDRDEVDWVSAGVLVDLSLVAPIRARLPQPLWVSTVSMQLQFHGAPMREDLLASSRFESFFGDEESPLVVARSRVASGGAPAIDASGAFMIRPAPAGHPSKRFGPLERRSYASEADPLDLTDEERVIYDRIRAAVDQGVAPVPRLWRLSTRQTRDGACGLLRVGLQVGNRVGDVQGGALVGLAASTVRAALPGSWALSGLSIGFASPGRPPSVFAVATTVHRGRTTAVVRVRLRNRDGKVVADGLGTLLARD